jgi:hypothetical protein
VIDFIISIKVTNVNYVMIIKNVNNVNQNKIVLYAIQIKIMLIMQLMVNAFANSSTFNCLIKHVDYAILIKYVNNAFLIFLHLV